MTDLKIKIVKTSSRLFFKNGLRKVSIDEICKELHISKKTFYSQYKSKEDLVRDVLVDMRLKLSQANGMQIPHENIIDAILKGYRYKNTHPTTLFSDLKKYFPDIYQEHVQQINFLLNEKFIEVLKKGINEGLFRKEMDVVKMAALINFIRTGFPTDKTHLKGKPDLFLFDALFGMVTNEKGWNYYINHKNEIKY